MFTTWQTSGNYSQGSSHLLVIQNRNILVNKNLGLVFLRIYKDGVYCC